MKSRRIHLTGASGSGVTTLGRALAGLPCPITRVDGSRPLADLVEQLCSEVQRLPG
ncbi:MULTISPECIES: hypothetical protein [Bradyrhizobium]|uniref:Uncharacterized protein n=1 Tax=Bradyrhizobium symbiodeficiens TaxID=1404367 RepID=A0ABZ2F0W7_9BRAD|nr:MULTISPECIES: hypothetical protein [Bradyrhizobium]QIO98285.1 hypothetical protein HAU86_06705 [Bradyrhizobium symbiodeficiens]UPJ61956.1 hypothetical protein IVB24_16165 [Bradyrhizobium sp. 192]